MTDYYAQPIVRTWTRPVKASRRRNKQSKYDEVNYESSENPLGSWHYNLTFDTETTTDERQRLRYGAFILDREDSKGNSLEFDLEKNGPLYREVTGIFWEDELPVIDPAGFEVIQAYANEHGYLAMSRHKFVQRILYPFGFIQPCQILGYNLPFDISRIAIRATYAKRDPDKFTFKLSESPDKKEHRGRAGIQVKKLGSHKSQITWTKGFQAVPVRKVLVSKSVFIDLSQCANAYSGLANPLSLGDAGLRYGCENHKTEADYSGPITAEYLDYCVNDVRLTRELYGKISAQHRAFSPGLPLNKVYSTASLAKHLLNRMRIKPPLSMNFDIDPAFLGHCEAAFYGARTEAHALGIWPGTMNDFTSMYPTCGSLMNISAFLTAQKIEVQDATGEVGELLHGLSLENCFDQKLWSQLTGIARLKPDGDILPFRARFGEQASNITIAPVTSDQEADYFLPDVVASAILSGKAPEISQAQVIVPIGKQLALKSVRLPGGITLDPRKDDIFRTLVEQRANYKEAHCKDHPSEPDCIKLNQCQHCANSLYMKILANSLYGIFAELNRMYAIDGVTVQCYSQADGNWTYQTQTPELPGTWCFPPLAGLFTSGARLMLAMLERLVTDIGGTYATTDTDSMFIIATSDGRILPDGTKTLTLDQVAAIREAFEQVSPYKSDKIRLLKQEGTYCYSAPISSKRYALLYLDGLDTGDVSAMLADGSLRIGKRSDHGLGYLMSPLPSEKKTGRYWKAESWEWLVWLRTGLPADEYPEWFSYPAVMQHTISTPHLHRPFAAYNRGKSYQDQVKPFNFIIVAVGSTGLADAQPSCIAPYNRNVREALFTTWTDIRSGLTYHLGVRNAGKIVTGEASHSYGDCPADIILAKTYGDILDAYAAHPERKAAGPDGKPSGRFAQGILGRLRIVATDDFLPIGKETNYADERNVGLRSENESLNVYRQDNELHDALIVLRQVRSADVAARVHNAIPEMPVASDREVRYILAGRRRPRPVLRKALVKIASDYARQKTIDRSFDTERARLGWYAHNVIPLRSCSRDGCANTVSTRQRYCSLACKQAGYRKGKKAA